MQLSNTQFNSRILLIEPPFYRLFKDTYSLDLYPLSLGYLSGQIKKETHWDVMTYNADFTPNSEHLKISYLTGPGFNNYLTNLKDSSSPIWEEIKSTIIKYNPSIIGISTKTQNFRSATIIAKIAKLINKEIIVIIGGPHASMNGKNALTCPDIDICVKGEGEETIVSLLTTLSTQGNLNTVNGIIYKENGSIIENAPRELTQDLDHLCFPHEYAPEVLKDYEKYPITAFKNIFATRGCPYQCFFCGSNKIWSRKPRFRSAENVIKEIKLLQSKGLKSIRFDDDTFGIRDQYIKDLCNAIITHCPNLRWECELHVNLVKEDIVCLMKKAGCYAIQIGVESGNDEVLKKIKKNITVEKVLTAAKIIKKFGIELQAFFIIGFPQDTEDSIKDTFNLMKKIKADLVVYNIFTPYPGTEAFEYCKKHGLVDEDFDISLYNHQSPNNCFCANVSLEQLRTLANSMEKTIDRKNSINRIKRIFSLNTLWRIKELGLSKSLKKLLNILTWR